MDRYPNISDHGLIGDLQTAGRRGPREPGRKARDERAR
jgi:hypothetical protein